MRQNVRLCVWLLALAGASLAQNQYHAKIALEDGTPLPTTPLITVQLSEQLRTTCRIYNVFGNGDVIYQVVYMRYASTQPDECPVTIRLKGYQTLNVTLRDGAAIVLKRVGGDHEGSTVSASALHAPPEARKAYEKGVAAMSDQKWAKAQQDFERAVAAYPDYAPAWTDLGETLSQQSKPKEARAAWERAVQADPKYVKPYLQLIRMALSDNRNEDASQLAERAMEVNSLEFPAIFFYHAVANLNLHHLDVAEKSALRAIELDANHEIPRAEHLVGTLLAARGDRQGAIQHLNKYLELSPKASDADKVRQLIADLARSPSGEK
ncbi:MAG: tetratricopeptide repeat protein [Bryobacteraceae bacterium]